MLVVDTSALLSVLVGQAPDPALIARLTTDGDLHAPHLLDVELLHGLRSLERGRLLGADRAGDARTDFADLTITRYPHEALSDRAWELRHNVTAYDAMFLALAEAVDAPLLTCDARLAAAAAGAAATVELYEPSGP